MKSLPEAWQQRLRAYILENFGEERDKLSASNFRSDQSVQLQFEDNSYAIFHYAFAVFDPSDKQCLIATEHCGYHIFPVGRSSVRVFREVHGTAPEPPA